MHRRRRNHIVIKFFRVIEIRIFLHFRNKNAHYFLCTLEVCPCKTILVIDHFSHSHKHLVLEQANLILIVLDKSCKFCVVCVQAFYIALDIGFIFNTEQAYLQFLILMHIAHNRLEVAFFIRETVNFISARIFQLSHAFLKDIRNFSILGQIMVHTAIQQFREIAACNIIATQIQALRRKRQICSRIFSFKRFQYTVHNIVHLYQGTDIEQDQFINQVHKRHEQGIVFHIAGQNKSTNGNERQRSNSDQSLITNIALFLCCNDNDNHIGQHVEIQQDIPQDMPRTVRRHIAAKAV